MEPRHDARWQVQLPGDLRAVAHDLRSIGVNELAWDYPAILNVIYILSQEGCVILGGDVYRLEEALLSSTGDSWFIPENADASWEEYVHQGLQTALGYVERYHVKNGAGYVYSIVRNCR